MKNPFRKIYDQVTNITSTGNIPDFPILIDVEITSKCNLRCQMCEHTYMKRKQADMTEEIFDRIIEQCKPYKPGIRFIMYSEPFLHPQVIDFARKIKEAGMLLHITNNGTSATKKHLDQLIDIGLDSITFSMQGATEDEYAFIRRNNKIHRIKEMIEYVSQKKRRSKPHIQVSTTISQRDKAEDIESFKEKWAAYADLVTVGVTCWSRVALYKPDIYEHLGIQANHKYKHLPCQDVLTKMCVYSNGDLAVCCSDAEGVLTVGNVMTDDMHQLWHSEVYTGLRLILKNMRMDMLQLCNTCYPAYDLTSRQDS